VEWVDVQVRRGVRERSVTHKPPEALGLLTVERRELLKLWVRKDNEIRSREALLKEAGRHRIEMAEVLCDWLLREGWISRKERLVGGNWQWDALTWRDLATLKHILGISSRSKRDEERLRLVGDLRGWLANLSEDELARDQASFLRDLRTAVASLEQDGAQRVEILEARSRWVKALYDWCQDEMQGTRRDFALHAGGHTKSIGVADWKWLEEGFDLDRLGVSHFTPVMWLAGQGILQRGERSVDLGATSFQAFSLDDLSQFTGILEPPSDWWLIENRTSFERQAKERPETSTLLVWMPGRPSMAWLSALEHLVKMAPSPLRVSADADPAGVDMACTMGRLWAHLGLTWTPYRMGVPELSASPQQWSLNAHDKALLARLLATPDVPQSLRELCETMVRDGRKAEQEGWL